MSADKKHYSKEPNQGESPDPATKTGAQKSARERQSDQIPFALRAWWLREFKQYQQIQQATDAPVTGGLWSKYSDPLCDQGSIDYGDDTL